MPDIVISNATPLITLLSIGKLELLKELYDKIYIPKAVFDEIEEGKHKSFYVNLEEISWVEIKQAENKFALRILTNELDKGEAEAIILYEEMNAQLLIIDEKLGRDIARRESCQITGSLGILIAAKRMSLITKVKPLLVEARKNGIHISDRLFDSVMRQVGEE